MWPSVSLDRTPTFQYRWVLSLALPGTLPGLAPLCSDALPPSLSTLTALSFHLFPTSHSPAAADRTCCVSHWEERDATRDLSHAPPHPCLLACLAFVWDVSLCPDSLPIPCWRQAFPWVLCTPSSLLSAIAPVSPLPYCPHHWDALSTGLLPCVTTTLGYHFLITKFILFFISCISLHAFQSLCFFHPFLCPPFSFEFITFYTHTHTHAHIHNLLNLFSVVHMYMCLGLTTCDIFLRSPGLDPDSSLIIGCFLPPLQRCSPSPHFFLMWCCRALCLPGKWSTIVLQTQPYKETFQKNIPVCHAVLPLAPEAAAVGVCPRDSIRCSCQPLSAVHVAQPRGPQPSSSLTCSSSVNFSHWSLCLGALLSTSSLELFWGWVPFLLH